MHKKTNFKHSKFRTLLNTSYGPKILLRTSQTLLIKIFQSHPNKLQLKPSVRRMNSLTFPLSPWYFWNGRNLYVSYFISKCSKLEELIKEIRYEKRPTLDSLWFGWLISAQFWNTWWQTQISQAPFCRIFNWATVEISFVAILFHP